MLRMPFFVCWLVGLEQLMQYADGAGRVLMARKAPCAGFDAGNRGRPLTLLCCCSHWALLLEKVLDAGKLAGKNEMTKERSIQAVIVVVVVVLWLVRWRSNPSLCMSLMPPLGIRSCSLEVSCCACVMHGVYAFDPDGKTKEIHEIRKTMSGCDVGCLPD